MKMGIAIGLMVVITTALSADVTRAAPRLCGQLDATVMDLEGAAGSLLYCARQRDFSNDCSSEAQDAAHAADAYESAVSDAESAFDDEVADICW